MQIIFLLIYIFILFIWAMWLPSYYFSPEAKRYIFIIGIVAMWRYTWALLNMIRAVFYKKIYFPAIRKKAENIPDDLLPEHIFILITTYKIPIEISTKVYRAAIQEAINCKIKSTVIASVVERHEEMFVKSIWSALNPPSHVSLTIVRFAGTGKRDGLAVAFRSLTKQTTKLQHSIVALVDGDSMLSEGSLLKCARLFALNPNLGALTTNEDAVVYGEGFTEEMYKQWYSLRFAQRDTYMSSLALSKRVLTLTGRMSVYKGVLFLNPEFAETVQHDFIEHWRVGWFRFLTGDDKSTWYYVLKNGWEMTYVPDAMVMTVEHIPDKSFFKGASQLMTRWFGNSLRATYRAMKVPRKVTGIYIWYSIRDQRITMWTGLFGLIGAIFGELKWGGGVFFAYLWWIFFSRLFVAMYYAVRRGYYYSSWPIFLYFNQIYGSIIKIYILNHIYKQKWTRQKTVISKDESWWDGFYVRSTSNMLFYIEFLSFIIFTGFLIGFFDKYDIYYFFINLFC